MIRRHLEPGVPSAALIGGLALTRGMAQVRQGIPAVVAVRVPNLV